MIAKIATKKRKQTPFFRIVENKKKPFSFVFSFSEDFQTPLNVKYSYMQRIL